MDGFMSGHLLTTAIADSIRSSKLPDELPSKIPCRYALLCLLVNLVKIGANAPIFTTHQQTHMRATIFNRRNFFPAPPFSTVVNKC